MPKPSHTGWLRKISSIACLVSALLGCAIADSTLVDISATDASIGVQCNSRLGSYALPKSYVHVVVVQTDAGSAPQLAFTDPNFSFEIVHRPDPVLTFCLDYLASAFANDDIQVTKYKTPTSQASATPQVSSQFLASALVNTTDQSAQIIRALVRAAFVVTSGDANFGRDVKFDPNQNILADLEYDPFDVRESARVNTRLAQLGLCLILEGFTFDTRSASVEQYCTSPGIAQSHPPRVAELYAAASQQPVTPHTASILYRPRQSYRLSVYKRVGSPARKSWTLGRTSTVNLENLSPVISVGLSRAMFAGRRAALIFDQGVLKTACVSKTSELEGFVTIPLEISRSVVDLPTRIMQVRINQAAKSTELVKAETTLLQVQRAHLAVLQGGAYNPVSGVTSATPRNPFPTPFDLTSTTTDTGLAPQADAVDFSDASLKDVLGNVCSAG